MMAGKYPRSWYSGGRGRRIAANVRPSWATYHISGQKVLKQQKQSSSCPHCDPLHESQLGGREASHGFPPVPVHLQKLIFPNQALRPVDT